MTQIHTEEATRPWGGSDIPGTPVYTGRLAMKGYALNRLCFSLNSAEAREAFRADPQFYCDAYDLSEAETALVLARDIPGMVAAGANIYYLAKMAGVFGLNVQDIGAIQTGVSLDEFNRKLMAEAT